MKKILIILFTLAAGSLIAQSNDNNAHTVTSGEAKLLEKANSIATTNYLNAASFLSSKLTQKSSAPMLFATGNFYFKADKHKQAETLYISTLNKTQDYVDVKKNLARLYLTTEQFDKAKDIILSLINSDPTNSEYYLFLGNAYMLSNFDTPAETAFRQCLMIDPINHNAKLGLCRSLLNQDKYRDVIPIANELLALNAESQVYWMLLANVQIAEGNIINALYSLETAKRLGCTTPDMEMTLANIYLNQNLSENAIRIYTKLLQSNEKFNDEQLKNIINALLSMDKIELSQKLLKEVKTKDILNGKSILKLQAAIYTAKNQQEDAVKIYRQILEDNPIDAETLIAYATYLKNQQLYEKAIITIKPVTRLKGHEATALLILTDIELERRNFQVAANYLENAMIFENNLATENYLRQIKKLIK